MHEPFIPDGRIDGTAHIAFDHKRFLPAADEAGDAASDFLFVSGFGFIGPIGIGDELPGKPDHIGFSLGEDFFTIVGIAQGMAGYDGNFDFLFHRFGRIGISSFGIIHGVHDGAGRLEDAGADIHVGQS